MEYASEELITTENEIRKTQIFHILWALNLAVGSKDRSQHPVMSDPFSLDAVAITLLLLPNKTH